VGNIITMPDFTSEKKNRGKKPRFFFFGGARFTKVEPLVSKDFYNKEV
jgi:hypothetical protein